MRDPSGDHDGNPGPYGGCPATSRVKWEPSTPTVKIESAASKASVFPSRDHDGLLTQQSPGVVAITCACVPVRVATYSEAPQPKAIFEPSGDQAGMWSPQMSAHAGATNLRDPVLTVTSVRSQAAPNVG